MQTIGKHPTAGLLSVRAAGEILISLVIPDQQAEDIKR